MDITIKPIFVLCVAILLAILCQEAKSLMCWNCGPCPDPFDKTNINYTQVLCNGTCMKTVTEYHDIGLYISRRCSDTPQKDECVDTRGKNEVCTCNGKDLCNGIPDSRYVSIATIITSLVVFSGVYLLDVHSFFVSGVE